MKIIRGGKLKKVLIVIESLGGGGAEKVLTTIIRHLDKSKFDVTVLLVTETGVYLEEVKKYCKVQSMLPDYSKIKTFIGKLKYKIDYRFIYSANTKKVYSKYVKEKYDVEIAFVEGYATKFVMSSFNPDSKKICWVHTDMCKNPYADKYFASIESEKSVYKQSDLVVCVSNSSQNTMKKKFELENCAVIYNPIDTEEILKKAKDKTIEREGSKIRIVTVGRLEHQKGYDRLIIALAKIKREFSNFQLFILGEGSMRAELEKLIQNNNLENNVMLLGFEKNPYPWIASSDAFICTSRAEGFSLAIAEAMTLGKPIFSVDCSGPNELLGFGKYGTLVNNTDESIYKMLRSLLLGEYNLRELEDLSKLRGKEFSIENTMKQIETMIEKI